MNVINAWKRIGETPLQTLERVKKEYGLLPGLKGCYTGRLDPMAQGHLILLFDDMIYHAQTFNHASKTYRFQAILGVSTTSYDPLGRITSFRQISSGDAQRYLMEMLKVLGPIEQQLPPCSAFRYKGQPLWRHMLNGTLPSPLPSRSVMVSSVKNLHPNPIKVELEKYRQECLDDINDVQQLNPGPNSFPYVEIIEDWRTQDHLDYVWRISFEANVTSGTYIRSLVHDLGARMGIPAHAAKITRTGIFFKM